VSKPARYKSKKPANLHQAGTAARHEQYLEREGALWEQIKAAHFGIDGAAVPPRQNQATPLAINSIDKLRSQSSADTSLGVPGISDSGRIILPLGDPTSTTSAADAERYLLREEAPFQDKFGPISMGNISNSIVERMEFWNLTEEHSRSNARIQNRLIGEIPHELARYPHLVRQMMERFCEQFVSRKLPHHLVVHKPAPGPGHDQRNIHFHLVYSQRPAARLSNGQWDFATAVTYKSKDRHTYTHYPHRQHIHPDTDSRFWVAHLREAYCDIANEFLAKIRANTIYRASTYADLGLDVIPQVHLGPSEAARERRGQQTSVTNLNNMIQFQNSRNYIDAAVKADFQPDFAFSNRARHRLKGADKDDFLVRELSDTLDRYNKIANELIAVSIDVERINSLTTAINFAHIESERETNAERKALDRLLKRAEATKNDEIQKSVKKLASRKFKELDILEKVSLGVDPGPLEKSNHLSRLRSRLKDLNILFDSERNRINKLVGMRVVTKKKPLPKVSDQHLDQVLAKLQKTGPNSLNPNEQLALITGVAIRHYWDSKKNDMPAPAADKRLDQLSIGLKIIAEQMAKRPAPPARRQRGNPLEVGIRMALVKISEREARSNPLFKQVLDRAASTNPLINLAIFEEGRGTAQYVAPYNKLLPEEATLVAKNQFYFSGYFDQIMQKQAQHAQREFRQLQLQRVRQQRTR